MKKIIRLTESDLTKIVKKTIMELDRSTYEKAADAADKKGFSKLSNKFREHGKEFGSTDTVSMTIKSRGNQIVEKDFKILKIDKEPAGYYEGFVLRVEDVETGNTARFMINKFSKPDNMEFYLNGDYPALPSTRSDAKKILKAFKKIDVDVSNIDVRSISYEDSDFK